MRLSPPPPRRAYPPAVRETTTTRGSFSSAWERAPDRPPRPDHHPPRPDHHPFLSARRAQLAAVLSADTGLGLEQWELKMFLNEFDLSEDRVTADAFAGVYTYLASRPPTPAGP